MSSTYDIGYLLHHLAFVLGRQSDQVLQERLGLGFSQYKILMILEKHPHIQQKTIADKLGQTEASISRQIKLLFDEGLLTTVKRPENKREHITTLTPKGERYTLEAMEILDNYHAPMFSTLSTKQQEALTETLQTLHVETCNSDKPGSCHHPETS